VRVFEWNGTMLHAKTAVADGRWARIGSTNLNIASWIGNYELDVAIEDMHIARQLADMYESDLNAPPADGLFKDTLFFDVLKNYLDAQGLEIDWETAKNAPPDALVNSLAIGLPFDAAEKQALLEAYSIADRRDALMALMEIDSAGPDDDEPPPVQ